VYRREPTTTCAADPSPIGGAVEACRVFIRRLGEKRSPDVPSADRSASASRRRHRGPRPGGGVAGRQQPVVPAVHRIFPVRRLVLGVFGIQRVFRESILLRGVPRARADPRSDRDGRERHSGRRKRVHVWTGRGNHGRADDRAAARMRDLHRGDSHGGGAGHGEQRRQLTTFLLALVVRSGSEGRFQRWKI